jgi:uncharacterized coiled-coil protein SlyX
MRTFNRRHGSARLLSARGLSAATLFLYLFWAIMLKCPRVSAQDQTSVLQQIEKLNAAMAATQEQLEQSQRRLDEMRKQVVELQRQLGQSGSGAPGQPSVQSSATGSPAGLGTIEELASAVQDIRERQTMEASQIATHEQTKVETVSKYPLKITGMLLLNGFVNTGAVDLPATPTVAVPGSGSVGAAVRQTVLGFDARGPHLFGADSFADLRMDFASAPSSNSASVSTYPEYTYSNSMYLRLRTAHAGLEWSKTQAYFAFDRPILSPDTPTSLTAIAEPALAWSGNLWSWNPQAVVTQDLGHIRAANLRFQAAVIDPQDAPLSPMFSTQSSVQPNSAERAARPGVEARIALLGSGSDDERSHLGLGGYFALHQTSLGRTFDSWAATMDTRLRLPAGIQLSGSFYRGLGLGGLGAGGYKDFVYKPNPFAGGYFFKALDDVGGWVELKEKLNERLQFNGAFGMDNVFSGQMRRYIVTGGTMYQNLTINRTFTGNVIYSPSASLLFSFEYRHIKSAPIADLPAMSDIFGIAAGYKF